MLVCHAALQRRVREQNLIYESNLALGTNLDVDTVLKLMTPQNCRGPGRRRLCALPG